MPIFMGDLPGGRPILPIEDKTKLTVLYREGGKWRREEIASLAGDLFTMVVDLGVRPEYLVLFGHYTEDRLLPVLGGGQAFTAIQIVGLKNEKLPFPVSVL